MAPGVQVELPVGDVKTKTGQNNVGKSNGEKKRAASLGRAFNKGFGFDMKLKPPVVLGKREDFRRASLVSEGPKNPPGLQMDSDIETASVSHSTTTGGSTQVDSASFTSAAFSDGAACSEGSETGNDHGWNDGNWDEWTAASDWGDWKWDRGEWHTPGGDRCDTWSGRSEGSMPNDTASSSSSSQHWSAYGSNSWSFYFPTDSNPPEPPWKPNAFFKLSLIHI